MRIDECVPCPRCGHRRVVQRNRTTYVCFQCRQTWCTDSSPPAPPAGLAPEVPYPFSADQQLRLQAYRSAIAAGLYTDWPTSNST